MMTETQIEEAARRYCEIKGISPDEESMVVNTSYGLGDEPPTVIKRTWQFVADLIRKREDEFLIYKIIHGVINNHASLEKYERAVASTAKTVEMYGANGRTGAFEVNPDYEKAVRQLDAARYRCGIEQDN